MTRIRGKARKAKSTGGYIDLASYSKASLTGRVRVSSTNKNKKEIQNGKSSN